MCGIAGFLACSYKTKMEILRNLELRGRDGFGFWTININGKDLVQKTTLPVRNYLRVPDDQVRNYPLLANTRAVPSTEFHIGAGRNVKHQQPFISERYALVFNGLIANDRDLIKKYNLQVTDSVDTAMLIPLFEKVGVVEGMKQLEGAFAIILYDKVQKLIYCARNFMPLHYYATFSNKEYERDFVVASLKEMFPAELQGSVREVPPYTCLVWKQHAASEADPIGTEYSLYKKPQNKKAMIIFSGGMDSVVTAYIYKYLGYDLQLVHFNYGQAAQEVENAVAYKIAKDLQANLKVFNIKELFGAYKDVSKLLYQKEANVDEQSRDAESTLSYVPNRNATLAMFVAGLAEMKNCDTVAFGAQQMDAVYADNTPDFVQKIDQALKVSLNWNTNIKFAAPLVHLMKHEIIQLAIDLEVPLKYVTSCYYPKLVEDPSDDCYICHNDASVRMICSRAHNRRVQVCEKCGPCQVRDATFKMLGVNDPQKGGEGGQGRRDTQQRNDFINSFVKPFI